MATDPERMWEDYYSRKKSQRMEEATSLWQALRDAGAIESTVLAMDFLHFGKSLADVESLATQLTENYAMRVAPGDEPGYWYAEGTTRPHGLTFDQEQHLAWVEFMADVAQSYSCVFSKWSLEAPALGVHIHSDQFAGAT